MKRSRANLSSAICLAGLILVGFVWCPVTFGDSQNVHRNMVLVKGGTFVMGDVFEDDRRFMLDEKPLHEVELDDFYIAKYETTVADFRAFVQDTHYRTLKEKELEATLKKNEKPYDTYTWRKGKFAQEDNHPVVLVAWEDAAAYCNWLSQKEGYPVAYDLETYQVIDANASPTDNIRQVKGYRLPTEAEWEYAAREGGRKVFYGNGKINAKEGEISCLLYDDSLSKAERDKLTSATTPVGAFAPNALGLYDMSGNAWEWCLDQGYEYTAGKKVNPYYKGTDHMIRGGSYCSNAFGCNVFGRINFWSQAKCEASGFRIARSAE
jgi:sulfatase modifying factor 1